MRLLLDTHAILWWLASDRRLNADTREVIEQPETDPVVSAAVIWEIETKRAAGRLKAPSGVLETVESMGIKLLPITAAHAVAAARLPSHHFDPFDRMLVAQAQLEGLTLVTRDERLGAYDVPILPA